MPRNEEGRVPSQSIHGPAQYHPQGSPRRRMPLANCQRRLPVAALRPLTRRPRLPCGHSLIRRPTPNMPSSHPELQVPHLYILHNTHISPSSTSYPPNIHHLPYQCLTPMPRPHLSTPNQLTSAPAHTIILSSRHLPRTNPHHQHIRPLTMPPP